MPPPFHLLAREGRLEIGGVSVENLAARFGTPLYVVDAEALRTHLEWVKRELRGAKLRLLYSVKANPSLRIVRTCLQVGFGLDVCSPGDVFLAFSAGAAPETLSYTGVGLRDPAMRELAAAGVHVNLDSLPEARRWALALPGRAVGLRVVPDIEAGFHADCRSGTWGGKFGLGEEELVEATGCLAAAACPVGVLHTHLGSSICVAEPYLEALDRLLGMAAKIPTVQVVNLGGGLAARYHPSDAPFPLDELAHGLEARRREFCAATGRELSLELEPGELLVAEQEYLVARVEVVKHWRRGKDEKSIAILDGGMNLMPAHSLYGSHLEVYLDRAATFEGSLPYDLYGVTNQSGDRLATGRRLPPLREDDLLVFRNAGAYAYCRSTQFNERPRPAEVWVDAGRAEVIRAAEPLETIVHGQLP